MTTLVWIHASLRQDQDPRERYSVFVSMGGKGFYVFMTQFRRGQNLSIWKLSVTHRDEEWRLRFPRLLDHQRGSGRLVCPSYI
jgi:hypothetical protein